ncbi:Haloacid dehalogenase-like hydrolase [Pseudobutyrivibrio sp. ACV-2]|uniref:HAD family hydrolase n=1 Tax=Pseudobutyrivibrio sp. ACV-2 TaxID=1520801 RepID=UPI00089CD4DF|nr:HAD hydrolase-like protein [Pseudobutyrivibrio sp. ACV-2]SEA94965.1 Haloacid dehalogenase-like hydrolase [Pseudobutyrivibrio sp. ACV-2]
MSVLTNFKKNKDFLICVDSDGCAMDTMNIKHIKCFGPCMIEEWNLKQWQDEILYSWNQVNLYTMTRGINRFKGLATALAEVNAKYTPIEGVVALVDWAEHAPELSNNAVEKMIPENPIFEKALNWSIRVNEKIEALPKEDIKPFEGVKEALEKLHEKCDVAVVSSANPEAVKAEWDRYGLTEHVDILCTQDMGSKAHCISELLKKGYRVNNVLMCGDAVGDMKAAASNGVLYYPICVNFENESWAKLVENAFPRFINSNYKGDYQNKVIDKFLDNLR